MSQASGGESRQLRLFLGCFIALVATAFGFIIRALILQDWREQFNLSYEEIGNILGAGLYPFAISIILFSLIIDRVGYGRAMVFAFICHVASAILTICAPLALAGAGADEASVAAGQKAGYVLLYVGTFIFALGNGTVEAVINPVVATIYERNKTHWLNILHAGWPGGLVLGGLLTIGGDWAAEALPQLPGAIWQWKMGLVLLPMVVYALLLMGQKFPVQERVAAGVSYLDMLREFGAASCFIVCFLLVRGIDQILMVTGTLTEQTVTLVGLLGLSGALENLTPSLTAFWAEALLHAGIALIPTILFLIPVRTFGRPMFVFLLLVMFLLATTELGTDSWIGDIMSSVLANAYAGALVLIYTSFIMFVLRFFAGPIVHRISPLGLLAVSAFLATAGLLWLSYAGTAAGMVFLAATCYGVGKTFFWPTTLGVVSEQYPKGGALMLNAIAGVGMIAVGVLGNPGIGIIQDQAFDERMEAVDPQIHSQIMTEKTGMLGEYMSPDQKALDRLPEEQRDEVADAMVQTRQNTLAKIAVLPGIMFLCYLALILYFRSKGGYQAEVLAGHKADDEKFTGGVEGPVE